MPSSRTGAGASSSASEPPGTSYSVRPRSSSCRTRSSMPAHQPRQTGSHRTRRSRRRPSPGRTTPGSGVRRPPDRARPSACPPTGRGARRRPRRAASSWPRGGSWTRGAVDAGQPAQAAVGTVGERGGQGLAERPDRQRAGTQRPGDRRGEGGRVQVARGSGTFGADPALAARAAAGPTVEASARPRLRAGGWCRAS